ncbi:hypothetical protein [Herbaspirillum sp. NPDC087042]|uniref:hypothetical protein n=1 Tax=Herbaspirillum sp. NPDC087042 TaxID=3364004 RepID=UPI0037F80E29
MSRRKDFRHDSTAAPLWRAELMHWFAVLLLLLLSGLAWRRIDAATISKLSVSAIVVTRCNVVVNIVNGAPVVSNTCGASPAGSVDGRASVTVSTRDHLIEVDY